ncbi:GntR family transcriptional regulator [Kitasatospora sp. NPDC091276]|uniref:GntR family transcriptional regulator n=1 Tax=unclassified Kitasatospora TaxID=2633591 RepID=UPI003419F761
MAGDAESPYLRIADHIRERILTGQLAAGAQLPSLAALREEFGYSHGVGQNAYRLLESEGLVVARHGRGYYVRSQEPPTVLVRRQRVPRGDGSPTEATLARQGVAGTWRHESQPRAAEARIAARLEIQPGDPVMHTTYVYLADGDPVQLAESWEPMATTGGSLVVLPEAGPHAGIGVADRMAIIGIDVGVPVERVSARAATRPEAQTLGVAPAVPVMAIERTYYDQATGRPVETADIVLTSRWVAEYGRAPRS